MLSLIEQEALWLSFKIAAMCMLVSLPFGILCSWCLAKKKFPGKMIVDALVHLPLVLPPVATGYGMLLLFGKHGVIGEWLYRWFGYTLAFSWHGAVVVSGVVAFPLLVRSIRLSMEAIDAKLEAAARTLGAGPFYVFCTITLPLSLPGIEVGMVLAFLRSVGEFGATITFVANIEGETSTLPLTLFTLIQQPGGEAGALRLVVLSVILSLLALIGSEWFARISRRRLYGATPQKN